jgi:predicted phage terminase large subunit-like protein
MKLGRSSDGHYQIEEGDILWPEKYNYKALSALLNEKGLYEFSCTPAETPILMADWTIKEIKDVNEGDLIMGWVNGTGHGKNHLCPTKVLHKMQKYDVVNDLMMESERRVRCTKDHRWYSGTTGDKSHLKYHQAKVGQTLQYVCNTSTVKWEENTWNYLGGLIDGEGSFKSGGGVTIAQSNERNPDVYKKIIETLGKLALDYKIYPRKAFGVHGESSSISIRNSREMIIHLLRTVDFGKRQQAIDWMFRKSSRLVKEKDKILAIREGKIEPVYALETETGNYIAWGYASSNCQYQNVAVDDENAVFHKTWFHEYAPTDIRDRKMTRFTAIDPAISLKERADFTAIVTIGVDVLGKIYVLEVKRGHYTEDQMVDELFTTNEIYHPLSICIETVAFQKTLQHYIMKEIKRRGHSLPLNEVMPESDESKEKRIRLLQPMYMRSDIFHSKAVANIEYLEDELLRFPKGKNDDVADAMAYAVRASFPPRMKEKSENNRSFLY